MKLEEVILLKDLGVMSPNVESNYKTRFGLYKCFCGNEFKVQTRAIKSGNTKSCGCLRKNTAKELNSIHNLSKHRLFHIRNNMIQRCNNKNHPKYKDYGERNIKVCNEWLNDFMSFYNWSLNNGYKDNLTIDRINNDLGYAPSNCRWATAETQQQNTRVKRKNNTSGYKGVSPYRKIWVVQISVNSKKIKIGYFKNKIDGALAYDKYVTDNNLEHTKNFN